ncbi:MFS transporter [Stenotrophomonas sp. CFBP 13718]|uniref:MFS transporter n=1 Tax=Stenotrophomonas sp. CFBP 13718 TaxID=2775304 RepID=UPI001782F618|nr:MFS transporter [Stenotrophomonas sp. CFBP 13718]MBD8697007.1 MFS transporter [Stenotrophomonas sp. CFBP 13718]
MNSDVSSLALVDKASILSPRYRATTVGMVALVALVAFEALAVAAAMPTVAFALDGLRLYALAFGGALATSVIGMTVAGRLCDQRGPSRPLWLGLAFFVIGLIVAGLAPRMGVLVAGRLLQGVGIGAVSVSLYVLVARTFPEPLRPKVFAAFSAGWVVPSLVGPGLSGLIVQYAGWRWVFLAVPVLALPAAWLLVPALRASAQDIRTDVVARPVVRWAVGAALAALLLYLGGQQQGVTALVLMTSALVGLVVCSRHLLPTGTLALRRGLPSVIALRGIAASAFFAAEAFLPLLLQRERDLSPLWAGAALSMGALGWFSGSWLQGHQRFGWTRAHLVQAGSWMMGGGLLLTSLTLQQGVPLLLALAGWSLTGLGMGLIYPSLSVLTLSMSPRHEQGANSSALQLSEGIAVATTLALSGALFAAFINGRETLGYLLCFAVTLLLALLATVVARRI